MSVFNVELKKVVDDSYDIEMGYRLEDQLVEDLETGLLGKIRKFAVITDSNVLDLYADLMCYYFGVPAKNASDDTSGSATRTANIPDQNIQAD